MEPAFVVLMCCAVLWWNLVVWRARRVGWNKWLKLQIVLALPVVAFAAMTAMGLGELAFVAAIVVAGLACLSFRYQRAPFGISNTTRSRE